MFKWLFRRAKPKLKVSCAKVGPGSVSPLWCGCVHKAAGRVAAGVWLECAVSVDFHLRRDGWI